MDDELSLSQEEIEVWNRRVQPNDVNLWHHWIVWPIRGSSVFEQEDEVERLVDCSHRLDKKRPFKGRKLTGFFRFVDSVTAVINLIIYAFCVNEWMLYIGGLIAFLDSTSTTMFRSMISKIVHANEVGKVFSIVGTFQALVPFVSGPTFGFLYKATVATFPQAFIFLIIAIKVLVFFDILAVHLTMRRNRKKQRTILEAIANEEAGKLMTEAPSPEKP